MLLLGGKINAKEEEKRDEIRRKRGKGEVGT
jgi:hypothetical protein